MSHFQPKLHIILINDSKLQEGTIDVLNEHFNPDFGINCGFIESFNFQTEPKKLKNATIECFQLLRETKMWAFVDEVVEVGCGTQNNNHGINIFASLKRILIDVEFVIDTEILIHGTSADLSLALCILTDALLNEKYDLQLSNYSTKHSYNEISFQEVFAPKVNKNYSTAI